MITKLRVGNLPLSATEATLRSKFQQFGTVNSATVVMDALTGRSKRFAFVEMANASEAVAAIRRLNMSQYDEATISVIAVRDD